jgi:hypothetical protein
VADRRHTGSGAYTTDDSAKYSDHWIGQVEYSRPPARSILVRSPMFTASQTLDTERYLLQCQRLLLDEIQRCGAALNTDGPVKQRQPPPPALGPASWIRPALCIGTGLALGGRLDRVLPMAAALELFQAGIVPHPLPPPLASTLRQVCARMVREALEGQQLQVRAQHGPLSGREELQRLHKQIGWGAFIPAALLGSLSADAPPALAGAMARYGLLLAIASHSTDSRVRQAHARRARLLLRRWLGKLATSVHQDFLAALVERCSLGLT